jgi:hypothetical protein
MPFGLQTLRDRLAAGLPAWFERAKTAGLNSTYAGFGALAMWPIVEEALRGNAATPAVLASALAAGAFGSLIAAQLERWRNSRERPDVDAVEVWIKESVIPNKAALAGLDAWLVDLDASGTINRAFPEELAHELSAALAKELRQLNLASKFRAALVGDQNAVAQADRRGLAVNVVNSPNARVVVHASPDPAAGGERSPATQRSPKTQRPPAISAEYLAWLKNRCAGVELLGLRLKHGQAVRLNNVYVPLVTTETSDTEQGSKGGRFRERERETEPLLVDRLGRESLYVSGNPGSGKSTFCRWVAWLACEGAVPSSDVESPPEFQEHFAPALAKRLPILVPLRDFWRALPDPSKHTTLSVAELEACLCGWLHGEGRRVCRATSRWRISSTAPR